MATKIKDIIKKLNSSALSMINGGILFVLIGSVLTNAISMISSIIVVRLVNKADYAALAYADNLYSYIALASGLGLSTAMIKFAAETTNPRDKSKYFNYAISRGCIFNLVAAVILCVVATFLKIPFTNTKNYVYILLLYPVFQNILNSVLGYLRASLMNREYALIGVLQAVFVTLFSVIFVFFIGIKGILTARYVGITIVLFIGFLIIIKSEKIYFKEKINKNDERVMLKMGISLMIANICSGMMSLNESFLINNIIRNETITANYKVASFIPSQIFLVTNALAIYFFPLVARLKDRNKVKKMVFRAGVLNFIIVSFCILCGILITPYMILFLYGKNYGDAVPLSYLLWVTNGLNAAIRVIPMNLLPAIGKTNFNAILAAISTIVQFVFEMHFLTLYGIKGIVYASMIVYLITGFLYWMYFIYSCKKLDFKVD
ncbi:MAG: oligosaccharide flippase family protein [[Clostridium] symbiosum]